MKSFWQSNKDILLLNSLGFITGIIAILIFDKGFEIMFAVLGLTISLTFSIRNHRINHDKMMKDLFNAFNTKYDLKFNETLNKIDAKSKLKNYSISQEDELLIIDYINFCSEEYLWYSKGRIDFEIWKAWKAGMEYYFQLAPIKPIIQREQNQKDSYYGLFDEIIIS